MAILDFNFVRIFFPRLPGTIPEIPVFWNQTPNRQKSLKIIKFQNFIQQESRLREIDELEASLLADVLFLERKNQIHILKQKFFNFLSFQLFWDSP